MPRGVQLALVGEGHGQLQREGSGRPVQGHNPLGEEVIGPLVSAERRPQDSSKGGWQLAEAAGEAGSWPG